MLIPVFITDETAEPVIVDGVRYLPGTLTFVNPRDRDIKPLSRATVEQSECMDKMEPNSEPLLIPQRPVFVR